MLLIITVFIIYLILGILYESFIHPITILTGLPFAAFGALLALYLAGMELGVYGYVGIIMLIGIVQKNAIMMIDFAIATGVPRTRRPRGHHARGARVFADRHALRDARVLHVHGAVPGVAWPQREAREVRAGAGARGGQHRARRMTS